MLRDALLAAGVAPDKIEVIPEERLAVDAALRQAQPGDLLLVFADAITRTWKQVIHFRPEADVPTGGAAPTALVSRTLADDVDLQIESGVSLIRDERGVRLAREEED